MDIVERLNTVREGMEAGLDDWPIASQIWEYETAADEIKQLHSENAALKAELETERLRLAACGVAALGYFEGCNDEYKSASLDDVLRMKAENELLAAGDIGKWRTGYRKEINDLLLMRDALKAELAENLDSLVSALRTSDVYAAKYGKALEELAALKSQEPLIWIDGGDLREVVNGNDGHRMIYCEDQGRMVPLYVSPQPAAVPAGWKLVPVEMTDEMWKAAKGQNTIDKQYKAMLNAAPEAPQVQGESK